MNEIVLDESDYEDLPVPLVAVGKDFPSGLHFDAHLHKRAQLMYAVSGQLEVSTEAGNWMVPPTRAVWIPPEMPHKIRATGMVAMKTLYIDVKACSGLPDSCRVLSMTPLLREMIVRATAQPRHYQISSREARLVEMIFDEIQTLDSLPFHLPMPSDPRLAPVCEKASLPDLGELTVEDLARLTGTSARNLNRIFRRETGMTAGQWKRSAAFRSALAMLAAKRSVTEVALDIGYENASNFITGFRRAFGETPGKYFKKHKATGA